MSIEISGVIMVLIKLDALSDVELRYIAQKETIENFENLSREELIDVLEDFYDENESLKSSSSVHNPSLHRFCKGLIEFESIAMLSLPGVEDLPQQYLETSIHLVEKDPYWAYVFWSISPNDKVRLYESYANFTIVLRTLVLENDKVKEKFDIIVTGKDSDWNIALPSFGKKYISQLIAVMGDKQEILAESKPIETPEFDLKKKVEDIKNSKNAALLLSSLVSKNGEVMDNRLIKEIFSELDNSDTEEKR